MKPIKNCLVCKKEFTKSKTTSWNTWKHGRKYCSNKCRKLSYKGKHFSLHSEFKPNHIMGEVTKKKLSEKFSGKGNPMFGISIKWTDERKMKLSLSQKGIVRHPAGWHHTDEAKEKIRIAHIGKKDSLSHRINKAKALSGNKNPMWIDGRSKFNKYIRNGLSYKLWREAVFSRDNWTCVLCGDRGAAKHPVRLEADHIKPFALYPELRFEISNGRTLCKKCHIKTDTYGRRFANA